MTITQIFELILNLVIMMKGFLKENHVKFNLNKKLIEPMNYQGAANTLVVPTKNNHGT